MNKPKQNKDSLIINNEWNLDLQEWKPDLPEWDINIPDWDIELLEWDINIPDWDVYLTELMKFTASSWKEEGSFILKDLG